MDQGVPARLMVVIAEEGLEGLFGPLLGLEGGPLVVSGPDTVLRSRQVPLRLGQPVPIPSAHFYSFGFTLTVTASDSARFPAAS